MLEPAIRRQNTPRGGARPRERLSRGGHRSGASAGADSLPVELVANYCWNTAVGRGQPRPLAGRSSWEPRHLPRARLGDTYAKIDQDATVAAFNTDDFFWGTGWEGHRLDLGDGHGEEQLHPRHRPAAALQGQPGPDDPRAVGDAVPAGVAHQLLDVILRRFVLRPVIPRAPRAVARGIHRRR